ncbi:MAG: 4-hydroxy-tetrahydrodipicolinate reductase [Gammaproteobacteria bacterium]|nr:4-hydroxy-tetrahydrodipicolinate reductase [Gammaproteobacteria bacterium]
MKIAIAGAAGRMGRALLAAVAAADDLTLSGALVRPGHPALGQDAGLMVGGVAGVPVSADAGGVIAGCDVFVDFTSPAATLALAGLCAAAGRPAVIGTTGLSPEERERLRAHATRIPLVVAANTSVGVTLSLYLLEIAARVLADADVEIVEAHHRHKLDAPSGTALAMGRAIAQARGLRLEDVAVYDRHARREARADGSIGFASIRAGEIVGEHRVLLVGPSERLEIGHVADDRRVFAEGALRAARFVRHAPAGLYDMRDVLGLR